MSQALTVDAQTLRVMEKVDVRAVVRPSPVLFMIYSHAPKHATACRAQYKTWGARARKLLFFSDQDDPTLPIVNIPHDGLESYGNMWRKVISMVRHAHRFYRHEFEWFMVCGHDTFVVVENLCRYLSREEFVEQNAARVPLFLGRRFLLADQGLIFNSGGAGYVLNGFALDALVASIPSSESDLETPMEDVMVARALKRVHIEPYDTRDAEGAERFHPFTPQLHHDYRGVDFPGDWYVRYTQPFDLIEGIDGISSESATFHYVDPGLMYTLDSLVRDKLRRSKSPVPEPVRASRLAESPDWVGKSEAREAAAPAVSSSVLLGLTRERCVGPVSIPERIFDLGRDQDIESDVDILWAVVKLLKPTVSVELGSRFGISTRVIADALSGVPRRRFYAVDPDPLCSEHLRGVDCEFVPTTGEAFFDSQQTGFRMNFCFVDVDPHGYEDTTRFLQYIERHLAPGGCAMFHDVVPQRPEIQVKEAVREWIRERPWWQWTEFPLRQMTYRWPQGGVGLLVRQ